MTKVGNSMGASAPSTSATATVEPEVQKQKPETSPETKSSTDTQSTKSSEQNATSRMSDQKMESSIREAEVRAALPNSQKPETKSGAAPASSPSVYNPDGAARSSEDQSPKKSIDVITDPGFKGLPKATQDKLKTEIAKDPAAATGLQKVLNHSTYDQMTAEQKTKMLNVYANMGPKGREDLMPLMNRQVIVGSGDPPPTTPALLSEDNTKKKETLLDHLDRATTQKMAPELASRRQEILHRLVQETGNPTFHVEQGRVGTCAPTTVQMHMLQHSPSEYARIVNGLSSPEKSVTLADGSKMEAAKNQEGKFLASGPDPRSVTERMFQSAIQQHGDRLPADQGGYGKDYKFDANTNKTGLWDNQTAHVMKGLYNREYAYYPSGVGVRTGINNADENPKVREIMRGILFKQVTEELDSRKGPVATHLVWGGTDASGNAHGLHEVLVERVENGRVYFRNPWGSHQAQGAGYEDGLNIVGPPPRRVEDRNGGMESMSVDDFKKVVNGATIGPPVGGA
jgi:hypothetical protein